MSNKIGFVDNSNGSYAHHNLIALIRHFCGGFGDLGTIGYTGTGNGTVTGAEASPTSVTETWTITCTTAAANGGTFSVVGSVSGAKADATVGTPYNNTLIAFTLNDGATDFIVGDAFTIPVTQGAAAAAGQAWEVLYWEPATDARNLILKGHGYSGTEEIFVGFSAYHNVTSDYYNLVVYGFTGYVPGNTMTTQPGVRYSAVPTHNQRIDYWLTMTPQRIAAGLKVGTPVYESFYVGKALPYATPTQYSYPMVVAGMLAANSTPATRFSETTHSMPYKGNRTNMALRNTAGSYLQIECWPWNNPHVGNSTYNVRDTGGNYPLLPIVMSDANGIYGELEGVFYISGFNNVVENTLTIGGATYVVIEDVYRTSHIDYYALRMDA
jgi:hypothetical protein